MAMATQGLLSIVRDGRTLWKIITGSDGYNIPRVAYNFAVSGIPDDIDAVYVIVVELFRPSSSLFVLGESEWRGGNCDEVPYMYGETFHRPEFNPRWRYGTADYAMILDARSRAMYAVESVKEMTVEQWNKA